MTGASTKARSAAPGPKARTSRMNGAITRSDRSRASSVNGLNREPERKVGTKPRVIVGDPDPLARRAIRDALQGDGFVVPAEAGTGTEALELCRYYKPEAALLEIDLPGMNGIEVTAEIRRVAPKVRVLIFSRDTDRDAQVGALVRGASGFIPKTVEMDEVKDALNQVLEGNAVVSARTTMDLIERLRALPAGGYGMRPIQSPLTQREWEVLDLLTHRLETSEIAEALVLTEETVYSHVKNVLRKLGVHSREEAVEVGQRLRDPLSAPITQGRP